MKLLNKLTAENIEKIGVLIAQYLGVTVHNPHLVSGYTDNVKYYSLEEGRYCTIEDDLRAVSFEFTGSSSKINSAVGFCMLIFENGRFAVIDEVYKNELKNLYNINLMGEINELIKTF